MNVVYYKGLSIRDSKSALIFSKEPLSILTSSCHVCLHSHKMLCFFWLDGLEGKQFHGFGKKILIHCKVNIFLKSYIYLKSENVNIENEGAAGRKFLNFWNLAFQNEKMNREWTDLPLKNASPLIGQPPWNQKYFHLPPKSKIPKLKLPLTLVGGAHYVTINTMLGVKAWVKACFGRV